MPNLNKYVMNWTDCCWFKLNINQSFLYECMYIVNMPENYVGTSH